jgi:hypothetical protein
LYLVDTKHHEKNKRGKWVWNFVISHCRTKKLKLLVHLMIVLAINICGKPMQYIKLTHISNPIDSCLDKIILDLLPRTILVSFMAFQPKHFNHIFHHPIEIMYPTIWHFWFPTSWKLWQVINNSLGNPSRLNSVVLQDLPQKPTWNAYVDRYYFHQ